VRTKFHIVNAGTQEIVGHATLIRDTSTVVHTGVEHEVGCTVCSAVIALAEDDNIHSQTAVQGLYEVRDRRWYARQP
jgi:hypothetical protein